MILAVGRMTALEELQGISLNMTLIKADPSDRSTVSIPCKSTVEGKLLFVNPIRNTIDYLVKLTVLGNLNFLLSIRDKDVVILDESDMA